MVKKKLNILERIMTSGVLPKENNFPTLKVIREAIQILSFSSDELIEFEIKQADNQITWNREKDKEVELELSEKACDLIKEELEELNREKKLTNQHFSIYEKFVKEE